jgi:hypothetical protein
LLSEVIVRMAGADCTAAVSTVKAWDRLAGGRLPVYSWLMDIYLDRLAMNWESGWENLTMIRL